MTPINAACVMWVVDAISAKHFFVIMYKTVFLMWIFIEEIGLLLVRSVDIMG